MNGYKANKRLGERINDYLIKLPTTTVLIFLVATACVVATLGVVFVFNHSWGNLTVGSITAPAGIEQLNDDASTKDRMRVFRQRQQDQLLRDSFDTYGIEGMKEIYSKQYNSNNNGNNQ